MAQESESSARFDRKMSEAVSSSLLLRDAAWEKRFQRSPIRRRMEALLLLRNDLLLRCGGTATAGWRRRALAAAALLPAAAALLLYLSVPFSPPATLASFAANSANSSLLLLLLPPPPPPLEALPSLAVYSSSSSPVNSRAIATPPISPPVSEVSPPVASDSSQTAADSPPPPVALNPPILVPPSRMVGNSDTKVVQSISSEQKSQPLEQEKPIWSMTPHEQLVYAKREIDRVPLVLDDPQLHAPLFQNVSVFKRQYKEYELQSYELMEEILKVYIYRDGPRPIFHKPDLKGIYASEGWFMKLMKESKKFVSKDPSKAHLFYLPYGARRLEEALYVPDSHNINTLALFLKNYVNMIAAKYPFWNRSRGADHFIVACHDWGPYTTREHDELRKNTIKALCNADISEGVFVRGKDVSLPETTIRTPKRPLRDIGGKPVSQRSILAFFAGNMHGRVRPILLKYWSGKDDDMKIYGPLPNRIARNMSYIEHMKSSKFCICPMGYEVNSPRIVEAIYYECVPVIIADNFVPPFDEVLNWSAFSVTVAEKDLPNLKNILVGISLREYISMQTNVKILQKHFLWHARPVKYDIFHMILHSIWFNRLNQIQAQQ